MKHRDFYPVQMSGNRHTFELADGRKACFRLPTAIMLRPLYDSLASIPDADAVPKSIRDALIIEAAGTVLGYLWDDEHVSLDTNWRTMSSFAIFGASVVDELMRGCPAIEEKEAYPPWGMMDLLNCLTALTAEMNSTLPSEKEVADNANFT